MKFLLYLERAWIVAGIASLIVMIYNLVTRQAFDRNVYFPLFCAMFCFLIYNNVKGQRKFREKIFNENKDKK